MRLEPIEQQLIADASQWTKSYEAAERAVRQFSEVVGPVQKRMEALQSLLDKGINLGVSQEQISNVRAAVQVLGDLNKGLTATNEMATATGTAINSMVQAA